jgi:hypothetical protein
MTSCPGTARRIGGILAVVALTFQSAALEITAAEPADRLIQSSAPTRDWPCRIIVKRPLLQAVEKGWKGSETFRRQCAALAGRGAIAELRPGDEGSDFAARTGIAVTDDGVVVGRVMVPLNTRTVEYIAHELEHILERAEGVDLAHESERRDSGVWRLLVGFETQRAIDAGRQVAREVRESSRKEGKNLNRPIPQAYPPK